MQDPSSPDGHWWQIVATTDPSRVELVADRLLGLGSPGVEERDAPGGVMLLAGFPDEGSAREAEAAIRDLVTASDLRPIDDDGLDGWREHARPIPTDRFLLVPSWGPPADDPDRIVLALDPGRTFGSGSHPTTRLCLDLLPDGADPIGRVLDVGTGSGVLAVAAALLGATSVVATDVDPASPAVVTANAERNGVAGRIRASDRPLDRVVDDEAPFDLVLANLLAPVIRELGPDLARAVAPGGRLIVSGLLEGRHGEATDPLLDRGLVDRGVVTVDGWCAVVLDRRPSPPGGP